MNKLELLKPFCAKATDIRAYIREPFRIGEYIYATNGAIAVRIRDEAIVPETNSHVAASITRYFDEVHTAGPQYTEIPLLPEAAKCDECSGTGFVHEIDCEDCGGNGFHSVGNHEYDCKECDGSGRVQVNQHDHPDKKVPCWNCDGTGNLSGPPVPVGNSQFARQLLALMRDLPDARFICINGDNVSGFVFDGGEGIIMPMRG